MAPIKIMAKIWSNIGKRTKKKLPKPVESQITGNVYLYVFLLYTQYV